MKTRSVLMIIALLALGTVTSAQSVQITSKKVTYVRRSPISEFKTSFTVNYPRVKAASAVLSRKIESAISYEKVLGINVNQELRSVQWLEDADYEVGFNKMGVLSISLFVSGSGPYPSGSIKRVVVDLQSGTRVRPRDVFKNLAGLATMVKMAQRGEIEKAIKDMRNDPENKDLNPDELFVRSTFTAKDLAEFSVNDDGVTFHYNYGFPHVIHALQPDGTFKFTWDELRPYIKPRGLLSRLAR
ncbi:MAG: hypothetical protein ABR530_08175 [Pyrinomonadaceae bacterium]